LGRRIEKSIGSNSIKYFYAKNRVIEERDSSDVVTRQYIYGNGIDEIIRMDRNESGTMTPYYYHTNSIGNVTAITDNTGALVERMDYDIYGMPTITDYKTDPNNPSIVSNSTIGNTLLFHGRRYDKETNLYYYRARYYDPITGRFLSTDPMGYQDSMNLYQAFNMNGVNFVDPMGEKLDEHYAMRQNGVSETTISSMQNSVNYGFFNMLVAPLKATDKTLDLIDAGAYELGLSKRRGEVKEFLEIALIYSGLNPGAVEAGISRLIKGGKNFLNETKLARRVLKKTNRGYGVYPIQTSRGIRWRMEGKRGFVKAPDNGKFVLGSHPDYINLGKKIDATYYNVPKKVWSRMSKKEAWKKNILFLDEMLKNEFKLNLSNFPKGKYKYFTRELWYLRSKGIDLSKIKVLKMD